jgi:hypothetical protein
MESVIKQFVKDAFIRGLLIDSFVNSDCRIWSLVRRIFDSTREVTRGWMKLHIQEFHNLFSSTNIITVIKQNKIGPYIFLNI